MPEGKAAMQVRNAVGIIAINHTAPCTPSTTLLSRLHFPWHRDFRLVKIELTRSDHDDPSGLLHRCQPVQYRELPKKERLTQLFLRLEIPDMSPGLVLATCYDPSSSRIDGHAGDILIEVHLLQHFSWSTTVEKIA